MPSDTHSPIDYTLLSLKNKKKKTCPICKHESNPSYHPFCSLRCKDKDLGNWVSEKYYIPGPNALPEQINSSDDEDNF